MMQAAVRDREAPLSPARPTTAATAARGIFAGASGWPAVVPAIAVLAVFNAAPMLWSLGISFYRYTAFRIHIAPRFVGLGNYLDLFGDDDTWQHVRNTGLLIVGSVGVQVAVGCLLAWLFHRPFLGRRAVLMLVLAPMLLSTVAVGTFFNLFFDPTFGLVSALLRPLLGHPVAPLGSSSWAMASLVVADAWMWSPFVMLMLMAGLDGVPPDLAEAAEIDRASGWRRFRSIVWPAVRGVLLLAVLFRVIEGFNSFDLVYTITNGGPGTSTETLSTLIYDTAFVLFQTGRASALANFSAFTAIVLVSLYIQATRRRALA